MAAIDNYASFIQLDGTEYKSELFQLVDDEFAEIVSEHAETIGTPVYFNSKGEVWPKPAEGVSVNIAKIWSDPCQ